MATDWAADVKKYVTNADDAAIAGIVRYCGIALRSRDSQLVAFSDKAELELVRTNYLKKKLGLTQSDAVLDKAIAKVGEVMKADRTKNRVTVYYLLAAEFKKLDLFIKKAAAKAPAKKTAAKAVGAAAAVAGAAAGVAAASKLSAKKAAAPKKAAAAKPAAAAKKVAAPKKTAAPKKAATLKAAPAKLMDKAADAGKSGTAAVVGTVAAVGAVGAAAVAAASGAADAVKDTATKAVGAAGDAAGAAAGAVTGAAGAAAGAVTGAASAAADKAGALFSGGGQAAGSDDDGAGLGWLWWALGIALAIFALWWLFGRGGAENTGATAAPTEAASGADAGAAASGAAASGAAVVLASAPAEGSVAIPAGAGVTSETRDGKPVVKVYFASGKVDVAPAFGPAGAGLKSWLDAHPGAKLAVTGYADPSGNAAFNADLSKRRAEAVQAELGKAGIGPEVAQLVKPGSSTDAQVPKSAARRVEVTVQ